MAASVEGAFVLLDRASPNLRKMRREAERTDLAFKDLGDTMDKRVSTNTQVRQMDRNTQAIRNYGRGATTASRDVENWNRSMRRGSKDTDTFGKKVKSLGGIFIGLRAIMRPAMFGGIAVAIGVAVQAVSALSAGAVSLIPKLTQLGGVAGALPAIYGSVGLAMGTVKLATKDLSQAMSGNQQALKRLNPEARSFLTTLQGFRPVVNSVRQAAQRGLFPGLTDALQTMRQLEPLAARLVNRMGRQLGTQASRFADLFVRRQGDVGLLGNQSVQIIGRMGTGLRNLVDALIDVAVSARPFTNWLTRTVVQWTQFLKAQAAAGRETGALGRYFDRTRRTLEQFGRIASNLWGTFRGITGAATGLGNDLYDSLERATGRWDQWANSMRGQNWLRNWFEQAREPLHELFGLVGDLGKAIVSINTSGLANTIHNLRRGVQPLQQGLANLANNFGPQLAAGITQVLRLLNNLTGDGGPVSMLLTAFTNILTVINNISETIPGLGRLLGAGLIIAGLARLRGGLTEVIGKWRGVETAADRAAAAQARASGAPVIAGRGGGRVSPMMAGWGGSPRAYAQSTYATARGAGYSRMGAGGAAALGLGAGAFTAGKAALGMAGRFIAPLMAFGGLLGAMQGTGGRGLQGLVANTASGASFGLTPNADALTTDEVRQANRMTRQLLTEARGGGNPILRANLRAPQVAVPMPSVGGAIPRQRAILENVQSLLRNRGSRPSGVSPEAWRAQNALMRQEIDRRRTLIGLLRQESVTRAGHYAGRAGQAFSLAVHNRGAAAAIQTLTGDLGRQLPTRETPGARLLAQTMYREALGAANASKHPAAANRALHGLEGTIRSRFPHAQFLGGRIVLASDQARLGRFVSTDPLQQERQRSGITSQQGALIAAYMAQGMPAADARAYVLQHRPNTPFQNWQQISARRAQHAYQHLPGSGHGRSTTGANAFGLPSAFQPLGVPNAPGPHGRTPAAGYLGLSPQAIQQSVRRHGQAFAAISRDSTQSQKTIAGNNRLILKSSQDTWQNTQQVMTRQSSRAAGNVATAMTSISSNLVSQLQNLGLSRADVRNVIHPVRGGGGGGGKGGGGAANALQAGGSQGMIGGLPTGDGTGRTGDGPGGRAARGGAALNLMGANPNLGGYASIGERLGLSVTSGLRPGSITLSGNTSFHSSGHAIDMSGSPGAMLRYAQMMASRYGSQLEELIHTPLGFGIKNGRRVPLSFWGPALNAQHQNHVHVADTNPGGGRGGGALGGGMSVKARRFAAADNSGILGAIAAGAANSFGRAAQRHINRGLMSLGGGDLTDMGIASNYHGPLNRRFPRHIGGQGITLSPGQVARLAASVGLPGTTFSQIAHGESGYQPGIQQPDPGNGMVGYGLWQITPNSWGRGSAAYRYMQRLGGIPAMFNPVRNAEMAKYLYDQAGHTISPWYGTRYVRAVPAGARGDGTGPGPAVTPRPRLAAAGDGVGPLVMHAVTARVGGRGVVIQQMHIHNHRPGDIRRQVKDELERAFDDFAGHLDSVDDSEPGMVS